MNIACVSDTHWKYTFLGLHLPKVDLLIHAGDFTMTGKPEQICEFNEWIGQQPCKHRIVIAGNHDWLFQRDPGLAKSLLTKAEYLQDSLISINGLTIYGAPWQPEFCNWAFNLPRGKPLADKWAMIPEGLDILITHGPPAGIGDTAISVINDPVTGKEKIIKESVGCADLMARVKVVKPKYHVFGHLHSGHGVYKEGETTFVNPSICDEQYKHTQRPFIIDTESGKVKEI